MACRVLDLGVSDQIKLCKLSLPANMQKSLPPYISKWVYVVVVVVVVRLWVWVWVGGCTNTWWVGGCRSVCACLKIGSVSGSFSHIVL